MHVTTLTPFLYYRTSGLNGTLRINKGKTKQMVWLGDFNKHHPLWDALEDTHLFTPANLNSANVLVTLLGDHNMEMALLAGIPTLQTFHTGNFSHPDNIFCSADLLPSFVECNMHPHLKPA